MQIDRRWVVRGATLTAIAPWSVATGRTPAPNEAASGRAPFTWTLILFRPQDRHIDVAGFVRLLSSSLTHHVVVANVEQWNGIGPLPIAVREVDTPEAAFGNLEATYGFDIAESVGVKPRQLRAIEIKITAPMQRDLEPFREIVRFAFDLGRATGSRFVMDGISNTALGFCEQGEVLAAPEDIGLKHIAPVDFEGRSIATEGLRRVGLPDLVMTDAALIEETKLLVTIAAEALLDGLTPVGDRLTVPRDHRAVTEHVQHELTTDLRFDLGPQSDAMRRLWAVSEPAVAPQVAQVDMLAQIGLSPIRDHLVGGMSVEHARALNRDVGALHARLPLLAETWRPGVDGDVFVRKELFSLAETEAFEDQQKRRKVMPGLARELLKHLGAWHRVVDWRDPEEMKVTAWQGDPRQGGKPLPPLDARSILPVWLRWLVDTDTEETSDMKEGEIRDLLILHRDGRVEGGEISATVLRLAREAQSARR